LTDSILSLEPNSLKQTMLLLTYRKRLKNMVILLLKKRKFQRLSMICVILRPTNTLSCLRSFFILSLHSMGPMMNCFSQC